MIKKGCNENYITAAIGPCIRQKSYNVKLDFVNKFLKKDSNKKNVFFTVEHLYPRSNRVDSDIFTGSCFISLEQASH